MIGCTDFINTLLLDNNSAVFFKQIYDGNVELLWAMAFVKQTSRGRGRGRWYN